MRKCSEADIVRISAVEEDQKKKKKKTVNAQQHQINFKLAREKKQKQDRSEFYF